MRHYLKRPRCNRFLAREWAGYYSGCVISELSHKNLEDKLNRPCFVVLEGDSIHPEYDKVLNALVLHGTKVAYVDTDRIDENGDRHSPEFYPDWNPDLLLSTGYIQSGVWFSCLELLASKQFRP